MCWLPKVDARLPKGSRKYPTGIHLVSKKTGIFWSWLPELVTTETALCWRAEQHSTHFWRWYASTRYASWYARNPGALAQVCAGRLAPWLAPIEGVYRTAVDAPPLARGRTLPALRPRVTQLALAAAQKKKPRIPMGVLTSKPVQVSPLSLGFPNLYTVLPANAGITADFSANDCKGLYFRSDPLPRWPAAATTKAST